MQFTFYQLHQLQKEKREDKNTENHRNNNAFLEFGTSYCESSTIYKPSTKKMETTRYSAGSFCGSLRLWATARAAYFVIHESEEQL